MGKLSAATKALAKTQLANQRLDLPNTPKDYFDMIGYKPWNFQRPIVECKDRFSSWVCHRRFGKSYTFVNYLMMRAHFCPFQNGSYAYLGPVYNQVKKIAWNYLTAAAARIPGAREPSLSTLSVVVPTLIGGIAEIALYGVDSPKQRIRGMYIDGAVFDEFGDIPYAQWTDAVRPAMSDKVRSGWDINSYPNQWAAFIGTSHKGKQNHFYQHHQRAKRWMQGLPVEVETQPGEFKPVVEAGWQAQTFKASETGFIDQKELDSALVALGYAKYMAEYECSFDAAIEGAVYGDLMEKLAKARQIGNFHAVRNFPVNTAWDLGWDDLTAIWLFQGPFADGYVNIVGYYETRLTDFFGIAKALDQLSGHGLRFKYGYHLVPDDVKKTEIGRGESRLKILSEAGIRVREQDIIKQPEEVERIQIARKFLPRCRFDADACEVGLDRLRQHCRRKDPVTGASSEKTVHGDAHHAASALEILAMGIKKVYLPGQPKLQAIAEL